MKMLIIEDNKKTAEFLVEAMASNHYRVDLCRDGKSGLYKALTEKYDIIILDLMLPKMDGLTVLKKMRSSQIETPVIILSAKHTTDDKIKGLQTGSDDYLPKPFSIPELLARIQAVMRRSSNREVLTNLSIHDLTIDLKRHKVFREDREIILQPLEYQLLEYLARNAGQIVTKKMIINDVWDFDFEPGTNIVETRICRLREKIDKPFSKKLIRTIKGCGYVLENN